MLLLLLLAEGWFLSCLAEPPFAYRQVTAMNQRYPICIVNVDAASQRALGEFPIDRKYYAQLLSRLRASQPRFVILKFFFTDPRSGDAELLAALKGSSNVLTQFAGASQDEGYPVRQLLPWSRGSNTFGLPDFPHAWPPTPELAAGFVAAGSVNGGPEAGFQLVTSIRRTVYPSLALAVLEQELQVKAKVSMGEVEVGPVKLPISAEGTFTVDLSEPGRLYARHSFIEVLNGSTPPASFSNHIVIVFADAAGAPTFRSRYAQPHGAAEIVADTINTVLKRL